MTRFISSLTALFCLTSSYVVMAAPTSSSVHHIDAGSIEKVSYFKDHISVFMTNGCVLVGQAVSQHAQVPSYQYKGQLCRGHALPPVPDAPFVVPPAYRE